MQANTRVSVYFAIRLNVPFSSISDHIYFGYNLGYKNDVTMMDFEYSHVGGLRTNGIRTMYVVKLDTNLM